jgi:nicotinate-nucleotide adenylyltransferase
MKSVALFGGTFNPIHFGHLLIAEQIRTKYNLDKVIFVPTNVPPHKESADLINPKLRLIMAHLATVSNPCFEVSTFEVDRPGKSYTIDTAKYFKQYFGNETDLYFIVGADMLSEISKWKNIEELVKICRFIAVSRPGYDIKKVLDQQFLAAEHPGVLSDLIENVIVEELPMVDISASHIRRRVKEWKSIKYFVPEAVEQFIHNHQLYL